MTTTVGHLGESQQNQKDFGIQDKYYCYNIVMDLKLPHHVNQPSMQSGV